MLKKLLVAVLACITLFLSQRTMTNESRARSLHPAPSAEDGAAAAKATRTAVLF